MQPSRSFVWLPQGVRGNRQVRSRVDGCPDGMSMGLESGDWLRWYDTNHRQIGQGLRQVLSDSRYSGEYYDNRCQCVRDRNNNNQLVTESPRYRAIPVFDPSSFQWWPGRRNFEITHFVGVFVERVTGPRNNPRIQVRVLPIVGTPAGREHAGPMVKVVRLVQ